MAKIVTVRLFLALAAAKSWPIYQINVNDAYLHGISDEDLYMHPLEGYNKVEPGQVCKFIKSLYGVRK